jgi:hypothetical protein
MTKGLDIAFFGSSLVSAYWNGAATYYRGIIRSLANKGTGLPSLSRRLSTGSSTGIFPTRPRQKSLLMGSIPSKESGGFLRRRKKPT